jgi:hypothetical protein
LSNFPTAVLQRDEPTRLVFDGRRDGEPASVR